MKRIWKICLGLSIILTTDAYAFLDSQRANLSCSVRDSKSCKDTAVFLRDVKDRCILNADGKPTNCLTTFCTANCALPPHQSIAADAADLCTVHCRKIDLMNHKLQEHLAAKVSGAWSEADAQGQYTEPKDLDRRNEKETTNFNSRYGAMIAQLQKAAWERVSAFESAKYFAYQEKTAKEKFDTSNTHYQATKSALSTDGFIPEEIKALLKDPMEAEAKVKKTPAKDIQIGAIKGLTQIKNTITRKQAPVLAADDPEMEITAADIMDDTTGAGI